MRFGACIGSKGPDFMEMVKEKGYDYFEGSFYRLSGMEKSELEELRGQLDRIGMNYETFYVFFQGKAGYRLVGDDRTNFSEIKNYVLPMFEKAEYLGGKTVVIGSGKTRHIPDGFSREKAMEQYAEFLYLCAETAERSGISIAIEPLNRGETNFINTFKDGVDMCRFTGHKNLFVVADFFHIFMNQEGYSDIIANKEYLKHVHIARANEDRMQPTLADKATCLEWADVLKKCGYDGRVSLEANYSTDAPIALEQARAAFEFLK